MIGAPAFAAVAGALLLGGLAVVFFRPAWVVDHPAWVMGIFGAICIGAAASLVRVDPPGLTLDIDPASEPLIRRGDPGIPAYRQAVRDFGSDDVYVIAMATDDVFTPENLAVLSDLTHRLRDLPGIASVESLARVLSVWWDGEAGLVRVDRFMRDVPDDAAGLAALRRRALDHPVYRKTLISADGRTAALDVTFQPMTDGEFVALDLDGRIAARLAGATGADRVFHVAGRPHVRSQAYHIMVRDLALLVPVAVAVAAVCLWLMSGSLWGMLIPLLSCLAATLWVFAALAILDVDINLITLVLGPMMICIGSVYGVHIYARYELLATVTKGPRATALAALCYARTPVLLAGLTTCIGFGALLSSDVPATNELGAFSIVGVAAVTLISLTAVPAAFVWLPAGTRDPRRRHGSFGAVLDRLLGAIAELTTARPGAVLAFWGAALAVALALLPRIAVDTDFITFFRRDSPVRRDFDAVNRLLAGAVPIYVTVAGTGEGSFREPAALEALARLQRQLEAVDGVKEVLSSVDLVRLANRAMHHDDPAALAIPATRAGVAETMFLLPKQNLRRYVTSNHSRANLIVRSGESGSAAVRSLTARIEAVLERAELPAGFRAEATANTILLNRSADVIAGHQATQVGLAAGAIFVLIAAVFRSLPVAVIAMVPNVVPVLLFFGVLGLGAAPLSIPTGLIGSIALGIAVDDTMHFLVAYQDQRRRGLAAAASVRRCIRDVGRPIFMTSVMLVVGFLVILASGFATLQEFGALTAVTMGICLSTDLLLLPALLVRFDGGPAEPLSAPGSSATR